MRRAALELASSRRPVLDVALDAGFGDLSTFNHRFRAAFGATPTQFAHRGLGIVAFLRLLAATKREEIERARSARRGLPASNRDQRSALRVSETKARLVRIIIRSTRRYLSGRRKFGDGAMLGSHKPTPTERAAGVAARNRRSPRPGRASRSLWFDRLERRDYGRRRLACWWRLGGVLPLRLSRRARLRDRLTHLCLMPPDMIFSVASRRRMG